MSPRTRLVLNTSQESDGQMGKKSRKGSRENSPRPAEAAYSQTPASVRADWPFYLLIILLAVLVYAQALQFRFVDFDDTILVTAQLPWHGDPARLAQIFTQPFQGSGPYYRPLTYLTLMIDASLGGLDPFLFHLTNLLLHIAVCLALVRLLLALGYHRYFAFGCGAIFAVHPLLVSDVAWVPGRNDPLLALFFCLAFLALIRFLRDARWTAAVLHLACFALAVFSKEAGLALPLVFAYFVVLRAGAQRWRRLLPLASGWTAIAAGFLFLRSLAFRGVAPLDVLGPIPAGRAVEFFFQHLRAIPELLGKFLIPVGLSSMPMYGTAPTVIGLAGLAAALAAVIWTKNGTFGERAFGLASFILLLLPGMFTSAGPGKFDYLEYRIYLPVVCLAIFLGAVLPGRIWTWPRPLLAGILAAVTIPLAVTAFQACGQYADPAAFAETAVRTSPQSALAYYCRGRVRSLDGNKAGAVADFNRAIELKPGYLDALENRGIARMDGGDLQGALADFNAVLHARADKADILYNRGCVRKDLGDRAGALADFDAVILFRPDFAKAYNNRAVLRAMSGDARGAVSDLDRVIALQPDFADAYFNRGVLRHNAGDRAGACADWQKAASLGHAAAAEAAGQHCP